MLTFRIFIYLISLSFFSWLGYHRLSLIPLSQATEANQVLESQALPILTQTPQNPRDASSVTFQQPDYPEDAPRRRERGTGSRGSCQLGSSTPPNNVMLTPLLPMASWGLTFTEKPTIWVQVTYEPQSPPQKIFAQFYLEKADTNEKLAPVTVTLPQRSGVFSISIPSSLALNQWYRWYLILDCQSAIDSNRNSVKWVEGIIQRIKPSNLSIESEGNLSQQLINAYAEDGIWYDALDKAAQWYCLNPQRLDFTQPWKSLLEDQAVDLASVVQSELFCPKEKGSALIEKRMVN